MSKRKLLATIVVAIGAGFLLFASTYLNAQLQRLPGPARGPLPPLEGPLVRIATKGAGAEGIWVRVVPPRRPRYPDGAPIVVHVPGGLGPGGVASTPAPLRDFGFVEVVFLFPGGESGPQVDGKPSRSGGTYDSRGPDSVRALADVIAFATGRVPDLVGKMIQDHVPGARVKTGAVGVIGWSLGGTTIAAALGLHGHRLRGLKWYASHESPYGEGVIDGEFGTRGQPSRFYDPETSKLDLSRLSYDKDAPVTLMGRPVPGGQRVRGALFLDGNENGKLDPESDFLFSGILLPGPPPKTYYSPMLTRAAGNKKVFGGEWPSHVASLKEAEECWSIRDGVTNIPAAVKNVPQLAVMIFAGAKDHVQDTADHLHIRLQYDGFRRAGVRWIRLNPDANYLEWVLGRKTSPVIQNKAGAVFDRHTIREAVLPEPPEGPTAAQALTAAACELADRTTKRDWRPALPAVLFADAPRQAVRPQR